MGNLSSYERQLKFKAKMYEAGYMQKIVWVKRESSKRALDFETFTKRASKILERFDLEEQKKMLRLLLCIIEAKKEAPVRR